MFVGGPLPLGADARGTWQLVRRVTTERDEVGHLHWFDTVPLANFLGSDTCHFTGAHRLKNRRLFRGKLKSIPVSGSDESYSAVALFVGHRCRQEIIGLIPRRLREDKAARGDEVGQHVKLISQLWVKLTSALVCRERTVTVGRHIQRVPGNQHCPRSLGLIYSQQKVCEAHDCARASIAAPANRLGKRVVGTMCERIAIDNQQRSSRMVACLFVTQDGQLWLKRRSTP